MAGLIFLWQGIPAVLVNTDSGLKPDVLIDVLEPILFVDSTDAVFTDSTVTVNDSVITVNDGTALVGGRDTFSWKANISAKIDDIKPIFFKVGDL